MLLALVALCLVAAIEAQWTAKMKCLEYRKLTVTKTAIIPLIARPVPVFQEVFNCAKTVDVIVGGVEALEGEFPHQALIGWLSDQDEEEEYQFLCGGSLISERYVLTAAHCSTNSIRGQPVVVRLGEHDLDNDRDHQIDFDIAEVVKHPNYKSRSVYHDIALIKLKREVRFSSYIRPACLWTSNKLNHTSAIASGFGQIGFLMNTARKLNKVSLEIFNPDLCTEAFPKNRKMSNGITDDQICAGSSAGRDTCKGDSGGPLQVRIEKKGCLYHLIGIISWGQDACGYGNSLAIYTKIASYVSWIEHIVWDVDKWIWD